MKNRGNQRIFFNLLKFSDAADFDDDDNDDDEDDDDNDDEDDDDNDDNVVVTDSIGHPPSQREAPHCRPGSCRSLAEHEHHDDGYDYGDTGDVLLRRGIRRSPPLSHWQ